MPCRRLQTTGWREYECGISHTSVDADCDRIGDLCAPKLALAVHEGELLLSGINPMNMRDAVRSVMVRRGWLEPEPEYLSLLTGNQRRSWLHRDAGTRERIAETRRRRGPLSAKHRMAISVAKLKAAAKRRMAAA